VLRDRPYWLLWLAQLAFSLAMMVLNFALPVYATTVLGLPGWLVGAVFILNCAMIGFGQGLTVRAMVGHRRWRVLVLANVAFAVSYVVLLGAGATSVALGTVAVLAATVVYTAGELLGGPVHGALSAEAAPEHLRGRYLSLIQVAWNLAAALAPVAFAWLLDRGAAPLWWGLVVVALGGIAAAAGLPRVLPEADLPVTDRPHEEPVAG
jgi:MFS family permease